MAIVDHEKIETFCIFGAADGFAVGYPLALQHPERVRKIIGLEIIPPILHNTDLSGLRSKMKTFGLASLYAPRTIRFMMGIAMHKLNRMKDRYSKPHPLLGVQLDQIEDADGLRVHEANFQDLMKYNADALWRDSSFASVDWAFAHAHSNARPQAAIIHCGNSMVDVTGFLANFAQRIGAQIYSLDSYLPHLTSCVPLILQVLEEE